MLLGQKIAVVFEELKSLCNLNVLGWLGACTVSSVSWSKCHHAVNVPFGTGGLLGCHHRILRDCRVLNRLFIIWTEGDLTCCYQLAVVWPGNVESSWNAGWTVSPTAEERWWGWDTVYNLKMFCIWSLGQCVFHGLLCRQWTSTDTFLWMTLFLNPLFTP